MNNYTIGRKRRNYPRGGYYWRVLDNTTGAQWFFDTRIEANLKVAELEKADQEKERAEKIRELAKSQHEREGEVEIATPEGGAIVSEGDDNGAYVQAWVWVDFSDTDLDKREHECDNCSARFMDRELNVIKHFEQRVDPGGTVPSGECPDCGALCYPRLAKALTPRA